MMLPLSCKVVTINPRSSLEFATVGGRKNSDGNLKYSLTLTKRSHVIIMYQLAGQPSDNNAHYFFKMRLDINSAVVNHTASHSYTQYTGNYGLWQRYLHAATHKIVV